MITTYIVLGTALIALLPSKRDVLVMSVSRRKTMQGIEAEP